MFAPIVVKAIKLGSRSVEDNVTITNVDAL
jgi:hypothetical protein